MDKHVQIFINLCELGILFIFRIILMGNLGRILVFTRMFLKFCNACFSFQEESSRQAGKSKKIRKDNKKKTEH